MNDPRPLLRGLFDAAVAAAHPARCLAAHLPKPPGRGRVVVVGAGKGSAAMAQALEVAWPKVALTGAVVVPYGHGADCARVRVIEAAHPVPDAAGAQAAQALLDAVAGLDPGDMVVALISGGGSSLLALPPPGIALADKQAVARALLASGAPIGAMNTVRRHLSAIKGGRLAAAAAPARVLTLAISDVPGDDLSAIASGLTVPDPTTCADALAVIEHWRIPAPPAVLAHLRAGADETVKPGDPRFARAEARIIATPRGALDAAGEAARAAGFAVLDLGDRIEGEAAEVGRALAGIALSARDHGRPLPGPAVILSGGETTVTVRGPGRGGRNVELLLAMAVALNGTPGVWALAADTDGIDGAAPVAGAVIGPDTLARARAAGLDARAMLAGNDAHRFFAELGDQVITGPTRTNVNDFRAILIGAP